MKIVKWISIGLLWVVTYIIGLCGVFTLLNTTQSIIYVPKEYFFTLHNFPLDIATFFIIFILAKPTKWLIKFLKTKDKGMLKKETIAIIKKYKISIFISAFLIIYIYITNVTVITNEYIKLYSPVNPTGIQYSYDDIASVNTGVYHNRILFIREKGQFYYKVKFNDGRSIDLMDLAKVHKEFNDLETYEEIEIMDKKIMKMRVSKISSDKYLHLVKFDPKYSNRFQRILDNK
ncbi:hypothetical protein IZY60_03340 [Lutibacter sp. B2]|nr:hypothetical protein [Lutibacter sp. B2]